MNFPYAKIAIPNYKTNTGKMAVELLSTSDKFDIIADVYNSINMM